MASPGLGLLLALGLPLLPARWGPARGQSRYRWRARAAGLGSAGYLGPGEVKNGERSWDTLRGVYRVDQGRGFFGRLELV